jgi:hypothetical protein
MYDAIEGGDNPHFLPYYHTFSHILGLRITNQGFWVIMTYGLYDTMSRQFYTVFNHINYGFLMGVLLCFNLV